MWPFTSRRIMGNRWWALAFAAYVCWQAADIAGGASPVTNATANRSDGDANPTPDEALAFSNTLNAF